MDILKSSSLYTVADLQRIPSRQRNLGENPGTAEESIRADSANLAATRSANTQQDAGETILATQVWPDAAARKLNVPSASVLVEHLSAGLSPAQLLAAFADYILPNDH